MMIPSIEIRLKDTSKMGKDMDVASRVSGRERLVRMESLREKNTMSTTMTSRSP
jgi:hypothetical protein